MSTELSEIYRAFSDPTRLRILNLLIQEQLCVCHIQEVLDLPQVNTSQHLAYLRKTGLVEYERVQTWKVYRLRQSGARQVQLNLKCLAECVKLDPIFTADLMRLHKALKGSRSPTCVDTTKTVASQKPIRLEPASKSNEQRSPAKSALKILPGP
jgi:DNA-binding transcriptional ArsR family regulator